MTLRVISPRDRRTLLLGSSVIASLFVLSRGVPAWRSWLREARAAAEEQAGAATETDALIASMGMARDSLAVRNERYAELAPALLAGATVADASAGLASIVSSAASSAGVKLGAVQLRPVADTGRTHVFMRVTVHADVVGDIKGITSLLATFERGPLRLQIHDLTLTQPDPSSPSDRVEALHGELTVEGLALAHHSEGKSQHDTH